jgi:hypothetical protein
MVLTCCPSWPRPLAQVSLLTQPPELLGPQACTTVLNPELSFYFSSDDGMCHVTGHLVLYKPYPKTVALLSIKSTHMPTLFSKP